MKHLSQPRAIIQDRALRTGTSVRVCGVGGSFHDDELQRATGDTVLRGNRQGGFALVLSLILVTVVAGLCAGFVRLAADTTQAQTGSVDQMRAFYLAEAGLAEAFHAVRMGRSGRIGSEANPAAFGDGLIWVQSAQTPDLRVWLRASATVGGGRAMLGLIVDPEDPPLGFFAEEDIVFDAPLLVDGFDSSERTYEAEVQAIIAAQPPEEPVTGEFFHVEEGSPHYEGQVAANEFAAILGSTQLLLILAGQLTYEPYPIPIRSPYEWLLWPTPIDLAQTLSVSEYDQFLNTTLRMREALDAGALTPAGGEILVDPLVDLRVTMDQTIDLQMDAELSADTSFDTGGELSASVEGTAAPAMDDPLAGGHTEKGGLIGSNGDIVFEGAASDSAVFGSVIPGVDGEVLGLAEGAVSGSTDSRAMKVTLTPVQIPDTTSVVDLDHAGLIPAVVAPGTSGMGMLRIAGGSEVVIRGPATLVVADMLLEGGSTLTLDTRDGPVELYITGSLDMDPASFVETTGISAAEVSIMAGTVDPMDAAPELALDAVSTFRGTVYAPDSTVHIGQDFEIFGSVACRRLEIANGARLHFDDESYNGALAVPTQDSWRILELPTPTARPRQNILAGAGAGAGAFANPPLADAHGLEDVQISVRYTDIAGVEQTYAGPESAFDWTAVASVEAQERSASIPQVEFDAATGAPQAAAAEVTSESAMSDREAMIRAIADWLRTRDWDEILNRG